MGSPEEGAPAGRSRRFQRRALARARERGLGGTVLLKMRPTLFLAVKETATAHQLSVPVFIVAVLYQITGVEPDIFKRTPHEIRRMVRG